MAPQKVFRKIKKQIANTKKDLLSLVYPSHCVVCNVHLPDGLPHFCLLCESQLQHTYFELFKTPSLLDEVFWGRVQLHSAYSLLYFSKMGSTQKIIHAIKYESNQSLANEMGYQIGKKMHEKWEVETPDFLIPVPLHSKKKFKRGYNQSEEIARGISIITEIPVDSNTLTRRKNSKTQTKKSKMERWENVGGIFEVCNPEKLKNKHICIVDDVITTGATIEACVRELQTSVENCTVSVVSIAFAR